MPGRSDNAGRPTLAVGEFNIGPLLEEIFGTDGDFQFLEFSGKAKTIYKPNGEEIALRPGLKATFVNAEDPDLNVTLNVSGPFHRTPLDDGTFLVTSTGPSLLDDFGQDIVHVRGRFSWIEDEDGFLLTPIDGVGNVESAGDILGLF
jgi:hypothetical protein